MAADFCLDAALRYAANGYSVLPLHTIVNGRCSCGTSDCNSPGKHPRTVHGVKDATADPAKIRTWWSEFQDANVGIATGATSGLVVLDVDGPEGETTLRNLNLKLPATLEVRSGRGRHLYFSAPNGAPTKPFGQHLSVRGDGAYVVAPPSVHASGRRYQFANGLAPIALAPEALLALLRTNSLSSNALVPQTAPDTVLPEGT